MDICFYGATREVTGSCTLVRIGGRNVLVDCGLIQGSAQHERHNHDPFPFDPASIDAVVLTHAHLDHSGRIPLLLKQGFDGPIYTHRATADLCRIMLEDAGYLNEKDAEWENRRRERRGDPPVEPLYTREEARLSQHHFKPLEYGKATEVVPGMRVTLFDAGHILGSAIVQAELHEGQRRRTVVFSGDLGHAGAPILRHPEPVHHADLVVLESTYGDRLHRSWESTWHEMGDILRHARANRGNILIPSFAVGRTQELLYVFKQHFDDWDLGNWSIFVDSPMATKATSIYRKYGKLYDARARHLATTAGDPFSMPNLRFSSKPEQSMAINRIASGAIIIAGSGMCTGGRIVHHLKYNAWRNQAHIVMVGFQAAGTRGRALVDGAREIHVAGETVRVNAQVHTVGGLSAHADQQGLIDWYRQFEGCPPVVLLHGEPTAMNALASRIQSEFRATTTSAEFGYCMSL